MPMVTSPPHHTDFPDNSPSFFAGFEMGVLYGRLNMEAAPIEARVHKLNCEAVDVLSVAMGWRPVWGDHQHSPSGAPMVDVTLVRAH